MRLSLPADLERSALAASVAVAVAVAAAAAAAADAGRLTRRMIALDTS